MDKEEGIRMVGIRRGVFSKHMWFFCFIIIKGAASLHVLHSRTSLSRVIVSSLGHCEFTHALIHKSKIYYSSFTIFAESFLANIFTMGCHSLTGDSPLDIKSKL